MTHSAKFNAATILLTVALSTNTFAQQSYTGASTKAAYAKNTIAIEADNSTKTVLPANPEIEASFSALFPNASNSHWSAGADNYWVSFLNNGRKANASLTPNGKMKYIITVCALEHLPAALSKTIKKEYATYSLFNAIEIKAHGAVAYQAILENNNGFTTLKYTIDGVEEIQQVKK
ncbi:MAG: hypothetical protein H0U44_03120 [Flavisolibacter sp.]|jgi:hypothetical protein|nr:hypothetical protein [Flavisolibacter sp.]